MELIKPVLILSTLSCTLVAGLVFTFAVIVMPGIKTLNDHDFLRAFQVMDGVIQNSQPLFVLVWLGSVLALIATAVLGFGQLDGIDRWLPIVATALYLFGVQVPTMSINVPLNNELQTLQLAEMDEPYLQKAREKFEARWVQWNTLRTWVAIATSLLLLVVLMRL